jgi:hypothetical protein
MKRNTLAALLILFAGAGNAQTEITYEPVRFDNSPEKAQTVSTIIRFAELDYNEQSLQYADMYMNTEDENGLNPFFNHNYNYETVDKHSVFEQIAQRTISELDNADIIDEYASDLPVDELLNVRALSLLFEKNNINVPGRFYQIIAENSDRVKDILNLSNEEYGRLISKSIEYGFEKICISRNESLLAQLIEIKIQNSAPIDSDVIKNEYYTRFYHRTKQALKFTGSVSVYVNAILNRYHITCSKSKSRANCSLPSSFTSADTHDVSKEICALRLRDAAQYVVELSNSKTLLNNALKWSTLSVNMRNCPLSYETRACILYKLGKNHEAVDNMKKAYTLASEANTGNLDNMGKRLLKMKRKEKIF